MRHPPIAETQALLAKGQPWIVHPREVAKLPDKEPVRVDTHRTGSITLHGHRDSSLYRGADPKPKSSCFKYSGRAREGWPSRMARAN
jgi:hypothetical protein